MYVIIGSALIAQALTMLAFAQRRGYLPVTRPTRRVYRTQRPLYFWMLIVTYALVGAVGVHVILMGAD